METLRHDFIADAHRAKLKAAAKPDVPGFDPDLRAGELSVNPKDMPAKGRAPPLDLLLSLAARSDGPARAAGGDPGGHLLHAAHLDGADRRHAGRHRGADA